MFLLLHFVISGSYFQIDSRRLIYSSSDFITSVWSPFFRVKVMVLDRMLAK